MICPTDGIRDRTKPVASAAWAGLCAGGYFAGGAAYLANALVLAAGRREELAATLMLLLLTLACGLMGLALLAEKRWIPKIAVVGAGALAAVHLIGLAFLFFTADAGTTPLARSLQWQLGLVFLFIWLTVLAAALRLARSHSLPSRPA